MMIAIIMTMRMKSENLTAIRMMMKRIMLIRIMTRVLMDESKMATIKS